MARSRPPERRSDGFPASGPRWTALQRRLHWIVALCVAGQYLLQRPMRRAVEALEAGVPVDALGFLVTTVHTWSGATVGLLLLWRLAVRRERACGVRTGPRPRGGIAERVRRSVAAANQASLYLVTGAMVVSGSLHWYAGVAAAARWHEILKWVLVALVALHVAGALWHALVRRDDVLQSMTGRRGPAARLGPS